MIIVNIVPKERNKNISDKSSITHPHSSQGHINISVGEACVMRLHGKTCGLVIQACRRSQNQTNLVQMAVFFKQPHVWSREESAWSVGILLFECLTYMNACSRSWLHWTWRSPSTWLSKLASDGANLLNVEFKFQRCSCKLSFLFLPRFPSTSWSLQAN